MATAAPPRYTPEDLLTITDRPMPELVDGRLMERESMGQKADAIAAFFLTVLHAYARTSLPGIVNGAQGGYRIFPDDPNKVRIPDVSFTRFTRIPGAQPAEGHSRIVPDLVVEVTSPRDGVSDVFVKLQEYLDAGVPLIVIINPEARNVLVFHGDATGRVLKAGDVIDGGEVLPGFQCPVADLFPFA